jgi:hypothetical protein
MAADAFAHAEGVACGKGIRAELDTRADLADLGRLFQYLGFDAAAPQGKGCGKAADSAAGNQYREAVTARHLRSFATGWHCVNAKWANINISFCNNGRVSKQDLEAPDTLRLADLDEHVQSPMPPERAPVTGAG